MPVWYILRSQKGIIYAFFFLENPAVLAGDQSYAWILGSSVSCQQNRPEKDLQVCTPSLIPSVLYQIGCHLVQELLYRRFRVLYIGSQQIGCSGSKCSSRPFLEKANLITTKLYQVSYSM